MKKLVTCLSLVVCWGAAAAEGAVVELPPGETALGDIGIYEVAWQSYGRDAMAMPESWTGHFHPVNGISYVPHEWLLERDAILLHSPWHVPPGRVWVDYRLRFPELSPITLSFGIAMSPVAAEPEKSDGVTFSASVLVEGQEDVLLHEHYAKAEWKDFTFDLTPYAGQVVTLRIQAEPGPANSPSWDYSYFGGARLLCGTRNAGEQGLLARLTSAKAYLATRDLDSRPLCTAPGNGITPSNLLEHTNGIVKTDAGYRFEYTAADCRLTYEYAPQTGTLDDFTVQIDEAPAFQPARGGGITVQAPDADTPPLRLENGRMVSASLDETARKLTVEWAYPVGNDTFEAVWTFGIAGKALTIGVDADKPVVTDFSLGHNGGAPFRKTFGVPYFAGSVSYLTGQDVFTCRYLDWTRSHASRCPQGEAAYDPMIDGARNPLHEAGYIAVSPNVQEVLPNIPHPPSPYLALLGPRIMLDIWGHHGGTFAGDGENLRNLKDNGVDHLAIISHVWQRYGYDVKLPDHLPPNPEFGGREGMELFAQAANDCGYVWSLHENYIDLYPDAPSYDPAARVLRADGAPSPAWFNQGTGVQSFGLKCNRALEFAKQNAPLIHEWFRTNAAYLDVHTCVPPWHQLDHEAGQPMAAMALAKVKYDSELFQYMRDTHEGPLFGEGNSHFYWAGLCDGVEAQVNGGEDHRPFLDFDLLKIHPQMVNHGMGYYERWFRRGYSHQWGHDTGTVEQIDTYRAQEIAYGHAGFIGNAQTDNVQWVAKEHHMMHPIQRLYGAANPVEIAYALDDGFYPASIALVMDRTDRQRIRYDSGLTVWVNWAAEDWMVEGHTLPQWGVLAVGPDTKVATYRTGGHFADYAECPEFVFADARTSFTMPYRARVKDVEPRLKSFEHLGAGRVRVAYEWVVREDLDQDYTCFVHFAGDTHEHSERIAFQQDHALPKPTREWRRGDVITDGPYEIAIPEGTDETFTVLIGLFNGGRAPLKGTDDGSRRYVIGALTVQRDNGAISGVTLGDLEQERTRYTAGRADFEAHMNPAGTWIDFGKLATDGSVKINKEMNRLTVFPYPRDREFGIELNLAALGSGTAVENVRVTALKAGSQEAMGPVGFEQKGNRVKFQAGLNGCGRYRVEWGH